MVTRDSPCRIPAVHALENLWKTRGATWSAELDLSADCQVLCLHHGPAEGLRDGFEPGEGDRPGLSLPSAHSLMLDPETGDEGALREANGDPRHSEIAAGRFLNFHVALPVARRSPPLGEHISGAGPTRAVGSNSGGSGPNS